MFLLFRQNTVIYCEYRFSLACNSKTYSYNWLGKSWKKLEKKLYIDSSPLFYSGLLILKNRNVIIQETVLEG